MPHESDLATPALARLAGVLAEDALFVLATGARDVPDALAALLERRGAAYTAAVQGKPHVRMTTHVDPWLVEMARAMAPVSPPASLPMMEVVREKVTLEIGARGLRSLFSSKPSDKDVARVKRYGALAGSGVQARAVLAAADGPLDEEAQTTVAAVIGALGLPDADANALHAEAPPAPEALEVYGEIEPAVMHAIVRGAWLAAAGDGIDPREEQVVALVARKLGVTDEDSEGARRDAIARLEARRLVGAACVDAVRYLLSDRVPGAGVQLAALTGTLTLPRRFREEASPPWGRGRRSPSRSATPRSTPTSGSRCSASPGRRASPGTDIARPPRAARGALGAPGRGPRRGRRRRARGRRAMAERRPRGRGAEPVVSGAQPAGGIRAARLGFLGAGNMASAIVVGLLRGVLPPDRIAMSDVKDERLQQLARAHGVRTSTSNLSMCSATRTWSSSPVKPSGHRPPPHRDRAARPPRPPPRVRGRRRAARGPRGAPARRLAARARDAQYARDGAGRRDRPRRRPQRHAGRPPGRARALRGRRSRGGPRGDPSRRGLGAVGERAGLRDGRIIEALADGGVKVGLHRDTALLLAAQTVFGSAKLLPRERRAPGAPEATW